MATNFDKITVSPEILADAVYHFIFCEGGACEDFNVDCKRCFLEWLKQEVKETEKHDD